MIWLFCKKNKQNKTQALILCFPAQKKIFLLGFYGANEKAWKKEERGRGELSETQKEKTSDGLDSAPHPRKTHRASGWPHRAQGQRWEERSLVCLPSLWCSKTQTHPYSHINTRLHTCTCIHTHVYLLDWWFWPLSLCSANQKTMLNPRCVSQRQGAAVETLAGGIEAALLLSCTKTSYG